MKERHKKNPLVNPQVATVEWLTKSAFEPNLTFNLTFKDNPFEDDGGINLLNKEQTKEQFERLNNMFKRFMCKLNRIYFGRKWHGKYKENKLSVIQVFSTIEVKNRRPHFHGSIEIPTHSNLVPNVDEAHLIEAITNCWSYSDFVFDFESIWDKDGWHKYITKNLDRNSSLGVVVYSNFSY